MKQLSNSPTMDHRRSFLACSFCFVTAFAILLVRLAYFQLWSGEAFRNLSENNRIRVTEIHAPRGRILDANHEILVDNRPCFDVTVIPEEVQDYAALEETLARLSPLPPEVLKEKLVAIRKGVPFRSHVLWKDASWDTVAYLEANRLRIPGVMIQVTQARDYLVRDVFAHSIGYMGEISPQEFKQAHRREYRIGDWIGKVGIEKVWEEQLRGKKGALQVEADARGRQISLVKRKEPTLGKNLVLSLERRLQERARQAFGDAMGVAIAADPTDGRVLCYLNQPSFDPNSFVGGISRDEWDSLRMNPLHPLTDRAIQGLYPPGSFSRSSSPSLPWKRESSLHRTRSFAAVGIVSVPGTFDVGRRLGHGSVDLHRQSCSPAMSISTSWGNVLVSSAFRPMRSGSASGRERGSGWTGRRRTGSLPGVETKTFRRTLVRGRNTHRLDRSGGPAGHSDPGCQFVVGRGERGHPVRAEARREGRVHGRKGVRRERFHRGAAVRFSSRTATIVQEALRDVVASEKGTGKRARVEGVAVAGKTGRHRSSAWTTGGLRRHEIPLKERDHAWFACYAPAESPEIVVVVLVEHGGNGGEIAAPIAREILDEYFRSDQPDETLAASPASEVEG